MRGETGATCEDAHSIWAGVSGTVYLAKWPTQLGKVLKIAFRTICWWQFSPFKSATYRRD
jgi:hypothetical protein